MKFLITIFLRTQMVKLKKTMKMAVSKSAVLIMMQDLSKG